LRRFTDFTILIQERLVNNSHDALKSYSRYANSMLILSEFKFADTYDFLLRSDLDCFIAPGKNMLIKKSNKLYMKAAWPEK